EGTWNNCASGSVRVMFTSFMMLWPDRPSSLSVNTVIFNSGENHVSVTATIGWSLPCDPASMICVVRVPVALTPSMYLLPRASVRVSTGVVASVADIFEVALTPGVGFGSADLAAACIGATFTGAPPTLPIPTAVGPTAFAKWKIAAVLSLGLRLMITFWIGSLMMA